MTGTSRQRRMQRVPNVVMIPNKPVKDEEEDEVDNTTLMIKVSDLVACAFIWSAMSIVASLLIGSFDWYRVLYPVAFMVGFLLLCRIEKVRD